LSSEKFHFLKMHECSDGLEEDALQEIADHAELVRFEPGDVIHAAEDVLESVYLIVQGRVKATAYNLHGREIMQRIFSRGNQFGGLAAALGEALPLVVASHGHSALLRFDYQTALQLTLKHEQFRKNMSRIVAKDAKEIVFGNKERKKPTLLAVFHQSSATRELTYRLIKRLAELGEKPCLLSDHPNPTMVEGVRHRSLIENGQPIAVDEIRQQALEWSDSKRVFIDLDAANNVFKPTEILKACEQIYWCVKPSQWGQVSSKLADLEKKAPVWREKIGIVWFLTDDDDQVPAVPELRELAMEDYKVSFRNRKPNESGLLANGFRRLIHHLRGIRVGVALGGGAARGMAHLGVLKALEESGIVIDRLAGTSAGAMTGALYSAGIDPTYLSNSFVKDLKPSLPFQIMPRSGQWYLLYKYRMGQFDPMLRRYLNDLSLEQLTLPMQSVTVDLVTGEPVVRSTGDAVDAILESINLPVLSSPICRAGRVLVDGGLVNNVPADLLVEEGCNFIIAVSVTAKLENKVGRNRPDTPTEKMKSPSTLQTILRSYIVQSMNMNSIGVQPADVVVEPDVTAFELTDFQLTNELAAIGEQATLDVIPQIKGLLAKLDGNLYGG